MQLEIANDAPWQRRLTTIVQTMREMSLQTNPQAMVSAYGKRMGDLLPTDGFVALSRRNLEPPQYRITRCSAWKEEINPWKQKDRLPLFETGLLGELIYGDEPVIIDNLEPRPDDPWQEYLSGFRSLVAVPNYDQGIALNMTVLLRKQPGAFKHEELPELVWMSNLFGRATHNLVLADEVRQAYEIVDMELKAVADIQKSLLPSKLPEIDSMQLATHYQTSQRAGGDYYDFFHLPDDTWGILIADVSGHGTPAAVMMAITHSIAHLYPRLPDPPHKMLDYLNYHLSSKYTGSLGAFVTAFYGVYSPKNKKLTYACAGHNPPRLQRGTNSAIVPLDAAGGMPLGIYETETYEEASIELEAGDRLILYTDGITEAENQDGQLFGVARMDQIIIGNEDTPAGIINRILKSVADFTGGRQASDDRTIVVCEVQE